ncbi:MAG: serine hydrolase [Rhodothermales bacterium]|nr:serine hydrolase [Rhodothermales bacterium]
MPYAPWRRGPAALLALGMLASAGAAPAAAQPAPWPTDGWTVSTPEAQGLDAAPLAALDSAIQAGAYGYVDRMVVVRNGRLVVDARYENDYEAISQGHQSALGCGAGTCADAAAEVDPYNYLHPSTHPFYQGRDVHTLQSVTKSVAATLIGVALARGEIAGLDAPLLSFFQDYDLSGVDERLHRATLEDLLTMRSGIEWHEQDRPLDETNTTLQLERSADWIQFTLDQPMDAAPGETWVYNSGGSHLMSGVIRHATGRFIDAYAEDHLFGPLGIDDYHWKTTPTGYPDTEGGLYLEAAQLAKIGYLYLRGGVWDGRRILDPGFVAAATARQVDRVNAPGWGYGYQWWRLDRDGVAVWAGLGFGGQFLLVLPEHDLIGVVNGWNLFGSPPASILGGFLNALIASAAA